MRNDEKKPSPRNGPLRLVEPGESNYGRKAAWLLGISIRLAPKCAASNACRLQSGKAP
jgi:hypothetical protein